MLYEFANPFLNAARHVFWTKLGQDLKVTRVELVDDRVTSEDITVFLGITGQVEGTVFYGFEDAVACAVITILRGQPTAGMDRTALSTLGELAAMITNTASTHLAAAGHSTGLTPPALIRPKGRRFTTLGIPQVHVCFGSRCGPFSVRVSLREKPQKAAA